MKALTHTEIKDFNQMFIPFIFIRLAHFLNYWWKKNEKILWSGKLTPFLSPQIENGNIKVIFSPFCTWKLLNKNVFIYFSLLPSASFVHQSFFFVKFSFIFLKNRFNLIWKVKSLKCLLILRLLTGKFNKELLTYSWKKLFI